jgi:hypothetical protein
MGSELPKVDPKQWYAVRRAALEAVDRLRRQELREMTDAQAQRILATLVAADPVWRARPDWSGLVEQQAIFHRRRKK